MSFSGNWNYPASIRFGPGTIKTLPMACSELGIKNPLMITDPGLIHLPIAKHTLDILSESFPQANAFWQIMANPTGACVMGGVQAFHDGNHDGIVAFGGGAALDVGKAVALMAGQSGSLWDYEDVGENWKRIVPTKMAPVVAVPTTSGTGSEVGRCSVIVKEDEPRKVIIFHPNMLPGRIVADPELTLNLPQKITAAVGMDALSHCLEAYCSPGYHPMADGIALEGMRLIHKSLLKAFENGQNIEARSDMMVASTMGATAFQKGLGAMHSLSHPMGAHLNAHHGLCNAIVMPYVLIHNKPAIDEKLRHLSRVLNLKKPSFDAALQWVLSLREKLNIPHTTAAIGFEERHSSELAPAATQDPTAGGNPIPLKIQTTQALFEAARTGIIE